MSWIPQLSFVQTPEEGTVSNKWAYEMSDLELLSAFMKACGRAGASNSGLVIDIMAGPHLAEMHYLRSVLYARLEKQQPPVKEGERMILKKNERQPIFSSNIGTYGYNRAPEGRVHEIRRVYYEGDGKWSLYFKDDDDYRYPAEVYERTDLTADAPRQEHHYDFG